MNLILYKIISLKSILTFIYSFILIIIITKIFPQSEDYNGISINRILYEIILETILLFLIVFTSKCFVNLIVKTIIPIKTKNNIDALFYISYSVIVSILFITINKSYKNKIIFLRDYFL